MYGTSCRNKHPTQEQEQERSDDQLSYNNETIKNDIQLQNIWPFSVIKKIILVL
jgi:hypothetical protein